MDLHLVIAESLEYANKGHGNTSILNPQQDSCNFKAEAVF